MTASLHSSSRLSLVGLVALAAGLVSACYKPSITDGGFKCSSIYKQECPSGFKCDKATNRCYRGAPPPDAAVEHPNDVKIDTPIEMPMEAPADKPEAQMEVMPVCITKPTPCTPMGAGLCDPMCQTGCPQCDQKCSVNTSTSALICNAPSPGITRNLGEGCSPVSPGTANQTDNCVPGLVCLPNTTCGATCIKFCRVDGDCPNSECSRTLMGGVKYCDVPASACNPVTQLGLTGCAAAQGCYISVTVPDETRCECPGASGTENSDCSVSHDCLPGLVCVDPNGQNHFVCARACKLGVPAGMMNGCSAPTVCNPITIPGKAATKMFGFCG